MDNNIEDPFEEVDLKPFVNMLCVFSCYNQQVTKPNDSLYSWMTLQSFICAIGHIIWVQQQFQIVGTCLHFLYVLTFC